MELAYLQGRGAPGDLVAGMIIFVLAVVAALGLWMALRYRNVKLSRLPPKLGATPQLTTAQSIHLAYRCCYLERRQ